MANPPPPFPALTAPVFEGDSKQFSWTWKQQLIEWKQQLLGFPIGLPFIRYGTGAPTVAGAQNCMYFDTSVSPYHGYIFNAGAWQRFS